MMHAPSGPLNKPGGSLNVRSAEFQRSSSIPTIGVQDGAQKAININSKEFMPSR
jgi:hypothetical protein